MPFAEVSIMGARREFVSLALAVGANRRELCRRFGISPTTGYHWIAAYLRDGERGLEDRSRRPEHSPKKTPSSIEELVLGVRAEHPQWGAPKIRRVLERDFNVRRAQSTIHAILRRHGRIDPAASLAAESWQRFEKPAPNDLWQIDFKGHFATGQGRCYPLTILDDHSRYSLALRACANEQLASVQPALTAVLRRYGLPAAMLMDNGNPWGNSSAGHPYTKLTVWLIRLGIVPLHSRPLHPQTLGKDERFHRTLKAELLGTRWFASHQIVQSAFDHWREVYNHERPHAALGMAVPADRYVMSRRVFPEQLPPIEYDSTDLVRTVNSGGSILIKSRLFFFSEAFAGQKLALRPTSVDGHFTIHYCHQRVGQLDLVDGASTHYRSESTSP
jgi:transposase InsO family protein